MTEKEAELAGRVLAQVIALAVAAALLEAEREAQERRGEYPPSRKGLTG